MNSPIRMRDIIANEIDGSYLLDEDCFDNDIIKETEDDE